MAHEPVVSESQVESILKEVLPELSAPPRPKPGVLHAFRRMCGFWWNLGPQGDEYGTPLTFMYWMLFALALFAGVTSANVEFSKYTLLFCLSTWVVQVPYWMYRSRKEFENQKKPALPTIEEARKRLLNVARKTVEESRAEVRGPNSIMEKRISERRQKAERARFLYQYYSDRLDKNRDDKQLELKRDKAKSAQEAFEQDIQALLHEQDAAATLLNTVESFIPEEEARIADDKYDRELAELCGEALTTREVSREMILQAISPIHEKLMLIEKTRQRLILLAHLPDGRYSIEQFIAAAEESGEEHAQLEAAVRGVERSLKAI